VEANDYVVSTTVTDYESGEFKKIFNIKSALSKYTHPRDESKREKLLHHTNVCNKKGYELFRR
jgi:hypothetical protein